MNYLVWLLGISAFFALVERLRPERPQPLLRRGWLVDLTYLLFNGHFYALVAGAAVAWSVEWTQRGLAAGDLLPERAILAGRPAWLQFLAYFILSDFLQWCVHVLLHRVPFLWRIHQVHHSVTTMDWAGNFRFHWLEIVVYRCLLYLPLLYLGGDAAPLFAAAIFGTIWGHFNHSNLRVHIGPLGYIFNSPRMHLWHHDVSSEGGVAKNFGIVLSVWDYLFRTAYWPRDRAPRQIGFPGMDRFPADVPRQWLWPLWPRRPAS